MAVEDRSFASVSQTIAMIRGLNPDEPDSPEVTTDQLQQRLNEIADELRGEWKQRYGRNNPPDRPNPEDSGLVNLILELLNLEPVWIQLTNDLIAPKYAQFGYQVKSFKPFQEARRRRFKDGNLDTVIIKYIKNKSLENDSFLEDSEPARETPGLELTDHTLPSLETAGRIAQRESAWVRAEGARQGYKNKISDLNTIQKNNWKKLVAGLTCPQIKRIHLTKQYEIETHSSIYNSLNAAFSSVLDFASGKTKTAFM